MLRPVVLALAAYGATADVCPGSDAWVHASCENTVVFTSTSCADVMTEMKARIAGFRPSVLRPRRFLRASDRGNDENS
jgi:hypothetical protein